MLVNNLLGNLQLKIVCMRFNLRACNFENFPGRPPSIHKSSTQHFIVPTPWPDHFRIASSGPEQGAYLLEIISVSL